MALLFLKLNADTYDIYVEDFTGIYNIIFFLFFFSIYYNFINSHFFLIFFSHPPSPPFHTENYAALSLPPFAPYSDVKKQWRLLGKKLHPDKCKEEWCEQEYVKISNAYGQISDYEKGKLKVVGMEERKKGKGAKGAKRRA